MIVLASSHQCIICGKRYTSCDICDYTPSWKSLTDTEEHFQIYVLITKYNCGEDVNGIIKQLHNLGVTLNTIKDYPLAKNILTEILSHEVPKKKKGNKVDKKVQTLTEDITTK